MMAPQEERKKERRSRGFWEGEVWMMRVIKRDRNKREKQKSRKNEREK